MTPQPTLIVLTLATCLAALTSERAHGHHDPLSSLTLTVGPQMVKLVLVAPVDELAQWHPAAPSDSPDQYASSAARKLQNDAGTMFELRLNYNVVSPSNVRATADSAQVVRLEIEYPAPDAAAMRSLQVFSNLVTKFPKGHQQVTCVQDARAGGGTAKVVAWLTLTADKYTAFVDLPEVAAPTTTMTTPATAFAEPTSFFALGVEHILTGYDHLLFLAALLLVCANFKEAATVITCFTVAHSITLALAALDIVRLPSQAVEAVIAASIVYVAMENVLRLGKGRQRLAWRAAVTFAFGLVHGLGFASVLRELGLGMAPGGVVMPLLKFNLGVEAGQLAVAAVVFPLIILARRRGPLVERRLVPAFSALIALAGAWWLFERVALT